MTPPAGMRRWLSRRPADAPARLFCFPYSGLGASMYGSWPTATGAVAICPVQLPGRETRIAEPHFGTYEQVGAGAADALAPAFDRPFGFFGHCGGALVAFATTLALARSGGPMPACLFVSSEVAPHEEPYGRYLSMTRAELGDELVGLARSGGTEMSADAVDLALDVLEADVTANRAYRLDQPVRLETDLYALAWSRDSEVAPALMTGWSDYASADRYTALVLDGEHRTFLQAPDELLKVFRNALGDS